MTDTKKFDEAIREMYKLAIITSQPEMPSQRIQGIAIKRIHLGALKELCSLICEHIDQIDEQGILSSNINISMEERALIIEYMIEHYDCVLGGTFSPWYKAPDPYVRLMCIYKQLGEIDKAIKLMKNTLGENRKEWFNSDKGGLAGVRIRAFYELLRDLDRKDEIFNDLHTAVLELHTRY